MTINTVAGGYGAPPPAQTQSAPAANALGKDDFLQLLVTSLRYQDPSEPMSTSELMAQTTQLSTMEQLTELTSLSQEAFSLQMRTSAAQLVGNEVSYLDADGMPTTGVVSAVDFTTAPPGAVVGDFIVPMNLLTTLGPAPAAPAPTDPAA